MFSTPWRNRRMIPRPVLIAPLIDPEMRPKIPPKTLTNERAPDFSAPQALDAAPLIRSHTAVHRSRRLVIRETTASRRLVAAVRAELAMLFQICLARDQRALKLASTRVLRSVNHLRTLSAHRCTVTSIDRSAS